MTIRDVGVFSVAFGAASQCGTQVLAYSAKYAPSLGEPWAWLPTVYGRHGLYWPWEGWQWAWQWGQTAPEVFQVAGGIAGAVLCLGLLPLARKRRGWTPGSPPPLEGHGTGKWADKHDIKEAGRYVKKGIVLAKYGRRILRADGPENVLLVGPTRQGKGIGIIIPTLLDLREHTIVVDIRGETWDKTAGYRNTFSRCLRLELTQPGSVAFNPLLEVRKGTPYEFMDAALLAENLVDPGGNTPDRDHWQKTSKALITCAVLYEVHQEARPTLANIARFWSTPGRNIEKTLTHIRDTAPTAQVGELAQEILNKATPEASGIISSMMTQLFLFRDPTLAANTARSDFRLADFTRHDAITSLYIVLSPGEEEHLRPFMRVFLRMALQRWMELGAEKHRITLILDEFTSWGRMSFFAANLSVLGGRGIRTLIAVQNSVQLATTYGKSDLITEQCKVRIYFAANGPTTGHEISRQSGTATATTEQQSSRREWYQIFDGSSGTNELRHSRALLTESEAQQIPDEVAVIYATGQPPIWAKKIRYWEHRQWKTRSAMPAPKGY